MSIFILFQFAQLIVPYLRKIRYYDLCHPYVKHTTKNKALQKQKSQTTKTDDLGFLFLQY